MLLGCCWCEGVKYPSESSQSSESTGSSSGGGASSGGSSQSDSSSGIETIDPLDCPNPFCDVLPAAWRILETHPDGESSLGVCEVAMCTLYNEPYILYATSNYRILIPGARYACVQKYATREWAVRCGGAGIIQSGNAPEYPRYELQIIYATNADSLFTSRVILTATTDYNDAGVPSSFARHNNWTLGTGVTAYNCLAANSLVVPFTLPGFGYACAAYRIAGHTKVIEPA